MAYFDWNATAPLLPVAREAWLEAAERFWANPSTPYRLGAQARVAMEEAREQIAEMAGVHPERVIFTSGATEANNAMIREFALRAGRDAAIGISAVEHPSVKVAAARYWTAVRVRILPVDTGGRVDRDSLDAVLRRERPALVSVMAVNNETGVLQPVREIRDQCGARGIPFHCDAAQWFGKAAAGDFGDLWADCAGVTLSAHKFGGPKGVGCLLLGKQLRGLTVLAGGAQEQESRAGTENVPGILSMVVALRYRMENRLPPPGADCRDAFERELEARWPGEITVHGRSAARMWNTSSIALPKHRAARWISRLDRHGFQVSSGSACSTGREGPSPVLQAMGVEPEVAMRTLRVSGGWETKPEDWEALAEAIIQIRNELDEAGPPTGPGRVIEL
ncbi:MAG: cysteine desulfurase family protein [Oceanipulchritudo sp.]